MDAWRLDFELHFGGAHQEDAVDLRFDGFGKIGLDPAVAIDPIFLDALYLAVRAEKSVSFLESDRLDFYKNVSLFTALN